MRRVKIICSLLLFALMLGGCQKKEESRELLPASHEKIYYEGTVDAECIAVDEEGILYTATYRTSNMLENGSLMSSREICMYDLEGNCTKQVKVELGGGSIGAMMEKDGILYCVETYSMIDQREPALYTIDTTTWEETKLLTLTGFQNIQYIVPLGEYIYLLGVHDQTEVKEYTLHPEVYAFDYRGEEICRVNINTAEPQLELMGVEFPIAIYGSSEETLVIHQYTEENGFCFLEFNPQKGTLVEIESKTPGYKLADIGSCEEGFLYWKDALVYYGTLDGMEAQVIPERVYLKYPIVYMKGFAYYADLEEGGTIQRICVDDIIQENKEIRFLMHEDMSSYLPYGCGYRMEKDVLPDDRFALKVLAQDRDFDVCFLSSRSGISYNLKENGVFYPLNKVDGVQEYLDACFPYVKEAAINEEGDIWMLPVELTIPGLAYNKEYCKENGVDLSSMDYAEFLTFTEQMEGINSELVSISSLVAMENFFWQYLNLYDSFDTEVFRSYARQFKEINDTQGVWRLDFLTHDITKESVSEFFFDYVIYNISIKDISSQMEDSAAVGMMGVPGISGDVGNVGTIMFLAVNPQSENLKETLNYISSFAKYMMTKKDSYMLADESMYTDTPFVHDWYELYAGGTIAFTMDMDVYWNPFNEYINGEIGLEEAISEMERKRNIYVGE